MRTKSQPRAEKYYRAPKPRLSRTPSRCRCMFHSAARRWSSTATENAWLGAEPAGYRVWQSAVRPSTPPVLPGSQACVAYLDVMAPRGDLSWPMLGYLLASRRNDVSSPATCAAYEDP